MPHLFIEEFAYSSSAYSLWQRYFIRTHFVFLPWSCLSSFTAFLGPQEPSRDCVKHKARWGQQKRQMEPKRRRPTTDQIIWDKHQMSTEFIHSAISRPHSTLYLNTSLYSCMDPLAIAFLRDLYSELNLKSRNRVAKRRPIRMERRPWAPLFQQRNVRAHV